jgi:hypothetical protein
MFGRRRGTWITFNLKDPKAKTARIGTACISTSAESAGHFHSTITSGRVAAVNDWLVSDPPIAPPQTVQDEREQAQV